MPSTAGCPHDPAPTTREAELARWREYEARREAVAHDAWMAERIRLMLTEGWF